MKTLLSVVLTLTLSAACYADACSDALNACNQVMNLCSAAVDGDLQDAVDDVEAAESAIGDAWSYLGDLCCCPQQLIDGWESQLEAYEQEADDIINKTTPMYGVNKTAAELNYYYLRSKANRDTVLSGPGASTCNGINAQQGVYYNNALNWSNNAAALAAAAASLRANAEALASELETTTCD